MEQEGGVMVLDMDNGRQEVRLGDDGLPVSPDESRRVEGSDDLGSIASDAALDPLRANAITEKALSDDENLVIAPPPNGGVTLLAGYVDKEGGRWTSAEVRELRGRDEEAISRADATGDMTRYLDAIITCGVQQLGEITEPNALKKALDTLLIGDREIIINAIRRATFGDKMRLKIRCPLCTERFEVDYHLIDDVPVKQFEPESVDDFDPSRREFRVQCPSGSVVTLRLVDGRTQKLIYAPGNVDNKNEGEINSLLLTEVVAQIDGKGVRGAGPILDMPLRDRLHLLRWLVAGQCGPQYQDVKQECPRCIGEFPLLVNAREMFRGE